MAHEAVPGSIILTWLSVFQASRHVLQSVAVGHIKPMASGPKSSFGLILPPLPLLPSCLIELGLLGHQLDRDGWFGGEDVATALCGPLARH